MKERKGEGMKARKGEGMKERKGEGAKGNKQGSSLRGTKQSSTGDFVGVFPLACFTSFAMTSDCIGYKQQVSSRGLHVGCSLFTN
jgi:hypothetical protein